MKEIENALLELFISMTLSERVILQNTNKSELLTKLQEIEIWEGGSVSIVNGVMIISGDNGLFEIEDLREVAKILFNLDNSHVNNFDKLHRETM